MKKWTIINLQSSSTFCGKFSRFEDAKAHAETYRGGIVEINHVSRVIYVSEIYGC